MICVSINDQETARFGHVCGRLDPASLDTGRDSPRDIADAVQNAGLDMVSVRVPVIDLERLHLLQAAGFRLMDTLVYWCRRPGPLPVARDAMDPAIAIRSADRAEAGAVGDVAARAFAGYFGHFHADPRLDRQAADAVYRDWAQTEVRESGPCRPVVLSISNDAILGFLSLRLSEDAEIVLNAVDPLAQGRGLYSALLRHALLECDATNRPVSVSTQLQNFTVQRIWASFGFRPSSAFHTLHGWFDHSAKG